MTAQYEWPEDEPQGADGDRKARAERRDAAEHRQRILAAARELFAEHGVEAVQMQQIARAAGVGQGTLYRRYANKGDLCMDLLRDAVAALSRDLDAYSGASDGKPALERLDALLGRLAAFVEENGRNLSVVRDTCPGGTEVFRNSLYCRINQAISSVLAQAVERGELAPMDVVLTADLIQAALSPDLYHFQHEKRGCTPEQILQAVRHVFVEGLPASETGQNSLR